MSTKRLFSFLSLLMIASMIVTGCAAPAAQTIEKIVTQVVEKEVQVVQTEIVEVKEVEKIVEVTPVPPTGPKTLCLNMGPGDIPTIDPALSTDTSSTQIVGLTMGGLTYQNEVTTAIEPGLANDWNISDDGLVYTFNLRDDVPWVKYDSTTGAVEVLDCDANDRMVTAQDFEYGILRTLDPETASDYAYVLSFAVAGADEFNTGAVTDTTTVGVKAIDPTRWKSPSSEPAAYNANIIGLWVG